MKIKLYQKPILTESDETLSELDSKNQVSSDIEGNYIEFGDIRISKDELNRDPELREILDLCADPIWRKATTNPDTKNPHNAGDLKMEPRILVVLYRETILAGRPYIERGELNRLCGINDPDRVTKGNHYYNEFKKLGLAEVRGGNVYPLSNLEDWVNGRISLDGEMAVDLTKYIPIHYENNPKYNFGKTPGRSPIVRDAYSTAEDSEGNSEIQPNEEPEENKSQTISVTDENKNAFNAWKEKMKKLASQKNESLGIKNNSDRTVKPDLRKRYLSEFAKSCHLAEDFDITCPEKFDDYGWRHWCALKGYDFSAVKRVIFNNFK